MDKIFEYFEGGAAWAPRRAIVAIAVAASMAGCSTSSAGAELNPSHAWTFDDGGSDDIGKVDLTMSGTWEQAGGAISLDGGSGYAASIEPAPVVTTKSFTVTAWVSLSPPRLLGKEAFAAAVSQEGSEAAAFFLGAAEEGKWSFSMKDADSNETGHTFRARAAATDPDAGRWVHLAGTYDADAGELHLLVDGKPAAQTPFDSPWQAQGPLLVGRAQAHGSPSDFWPGAVADVRTFDAALASGKIRDVMEQTRPTDPPPSWPAVKDEVSALNGTFEYEMTHAESKRLEGLFGPEAVAAGFPGDATIVYRFADGVWQQYFLVDREPYLVDGRAEGDGGTYRTNGDSLVVNGAGHYRWSLEGDVLSLSFLDNPADADIVRFITERDFTRAAD